MAWFPHQQQQMVPVVVCPVAPSIPVLVPATISAMVFPPPGTPVRGHQQRCEGDGMGAGGRGAWPGPSKGLALPGGAVMAAQQQQAAFHAGLPLDSQRFPAHGSEGPSSGEDGKCWDAFSTCSTDLKSEGSTETGSPARRGSMGSMEAWSPARGGSISSESEAGSPACRGSVCAEAGSPAREEYETDEEGMCIHACQRHEEHWQGECDDATWRLKKTASIRITFGTVTRHPDFNHVAVHEAAICTACGKEASGLWHAKGCLKCGKKRPQFQGKQGGAAVVKCGKCGELAVGCKKPLRRCKCKKTALELSLGTLCPHVKAVVSVGCTHNRTGNCNREHCSFCHCAAPHRPDKKQSRHGARSGGGQETWTIGWSDYWHNYVKVQMVGRFIEDYVVFNKRNDVVDLLRQPQDKNNFPLRFVLKAKNNKARQEPPTDWIASVGTVFQSKGSQ